MKNNAEGGAKSNVDRHVSGARQGTTPQGQPGYSPPEGGKKRGVYKTMPWERGRALKSKHKGFRG